MILKIVPHLVRFAIEGYVIYRMHDETGFWTVIFAIFMTIIVEGFGFLALIQKDMNRLIREHIQSHTVNTLKDSLLKEMLAVLHNIRNGTDANPPV